MDPSDKKEYGKADISIVEESPLFKNLDKELTVWMSHGDQLSKLPLGFSTVATTSTAPFAAVQKIDSSIFGIQFHPEVTHTPQGKLILKNFVIGVCKASSNWTMVFFYAIILFAGLICGKGNRTHSIHCRAHCASHWCCKRRRGFNSCCTTDE